MGLFGRRKKAEQPCTEQRNYGKAIEVSCPPHHIEIGPHFQHPRPKQGQQGKQSFYQRQTQQRPGQRPALRPSTPHQQGSSQAQATEQYPPPPCQENKSDSAMATAKTTAKPTPASRPGNQSLIPHLMVLEWGDGLKQQPDEQDEKKPTIEGSFLKVQYGTIHHIGSWL